MTEPEALRIGRKMYEELPHLIQPSKGDIALAHLYQMYIKELYNHSLWFRIKQLFKKDTVLTEEQRKQWEQYEHDKGLI